MKSYMRATIAQDAALSTLVHLANALIVGILMPAEWTAADLTFQAGTTANDLAELQDIPTSGVAVAAFTITTPGAAKFIPVNPQLFAGAAVLKVRSGTAASAVNQAAARTIKIITLPLHD